LLCNTAQALAAFRERRLAPAEPLAALERAWRLQQDLTQLLKVALEDGEDPAQEPAPFRARMARAGHARNFPTLRRSLEAAQSAARAAYETLLSGADGTR
jgi:glutamate-ammonia-ligase adenylyltransferase